MGEEPEPNRFLHLKLKNLAFYVLTNFLNRFCQTIKKTAAQKSAFKNSRNLPN